MTDLPPDTVPHSHEAERGLLSCCMQNPQELIPRARTRLAPDAFHHPAHATIWDWLLRLLDANKPIDLATLTNAIREAGNSTLENIGGPGELSDIYIYLPVTDHFDHYLTIILERVTLRRLIEASKGIISKAMRYGQDTVEANAADLVAAAESEVFALLQQTVQATGGTAAIPSHTGVIDWVEHMQRVIDNRGKIMGLRTGIHELDMTMHGLDDSEGEILVLAGRPAMGKTALGVTLIHNICIGDAVPGLMFSAEMSANQVYTRLVLGGAGIDTAKATTGMFSHHDQEAMRRHVPLVQKATLLINASSQITTADLRAQVQMAKRQHGIRWIMVDHLHLIKPVSAQAQKDERMKLVEVMETLQFIKKEHKVIVFLLVQMSRESDRNAGKPPVLADLSGSAAIEQYADHVVFIHRDDEYVKWHRLSEDAQNAWSNQIAPRRDRSPQCWSSGEKYRDDEGGWAREDYEEKAMFYVRKNRRGPTPELQVRYQKTLTRFSSRMPTLTSNNPLDHQMGSYTVPKKKATNDKAPRSMRGAQLESPFDDDDT